VAGYRRGLRLPDSVVVVTGASSGIGRATALALARAGARPVLVARRAHELDRVAAACAEHGVEALPVAADVTDPDAVEEVARRAVERFGRLDGGVNCAAVMMFGSLLDVPLQDVRRLLDVNVLGYVHGARAAVPRMIAQERGVLVNVSSLLGQIALPYGAAYSMSKAAVRAMAAALREELRLDGVRGVAVTTVLVPAIDTPIYRVAANHSGRTPHPPPPVYSAERVAATILRQLRTPRLEVVAGGPLAKAITHGHPLAPIVTERILAQETKWLGLRDPTVGPSSGNLHHPDAEPAAVSGGWHGQRRQNVRRAGLGLTIAAGVAAAARSTWLHHRIGRRPGG
jgi:NAD(P)-dependent dehydrogenase (short-subunit alcohol dehydrogenase family)